VDQVPQLFAHAYTRQCSFVTLAILLLLSFAAPGQAATLTATWNPNPEPDIAGYRLSYGTTSGSYTTTIDVGKVTSAAVTVTEGQTYYFAVRAYNTSGGISTYSAEVSATVSSATTPSQPTASTSGIAFVQQAYADPASATTVSVTLPAAQTAGNLNVVAVGWNDTTRTVQSVTDSKGNSYALAVGPTLLAGQLTHAIYYAKNIAAAAAGANTVTVTFSGAATYPDVRVAEYRGLDPVSPLEGGTGASGSALTSDSGAWTTTNASDLLVGANVVTAHVTGPGAGYTSRVVTSPDADILEDQIVTAAGTYHATASVSGGSWVMQLVAFRAAATTSSVPSITSLTPTSGPVGTAVTIVGTSFGSTQGTSTVTFNGATATPTSWSATSIIVPVPGGATSGNVVVTVGGVASNAKAFTVTSALPSIVSLTPSSGPVGTPVTIAGANFGSTQGTGTVTFNGTWATPTSWSATSIVVPVPAGATTGSVVVTAGGVASNGQTFTVTTPATISFVQKNSATPQSPTASVSVPFTAAQTAGNLNVVVVGWNDTTQTVQSVADSKGNAYVRAVGPTVLTGVLTQSIYYAKNIVAAAAGANSVTVAFSGAAVYPDVRIAEYKGIDPANPFDGAIGATGTALTSDSGALTTTTANDLLVGANTVTAHTTAAGTGYTPRVITSPNGDILEDRVVTVTGSYNATAPVSGGSWVMQLVAFRAAGGAPVVTSLALMSAAAPVPMPDDASRASDYDGDLKSDLAVFTPSTGKWAVLQSSSNYMNSFSLVLGGSAYVPVPGDYDGDGKADIAVYAPSTGKWTVWKSTSSYASSMSTTWGVTGDIAVPGDYDGDRKTDFAVYRPSTGEWLLTLSATQTTKTVVLGASGDKPVAGDYDGDGRTDVALFRPSTGVWTVLTSSSNYTSQLTGTIGPATDLLVPGDYDGDGRMDMAVYRPSTGSWLILGSASGYTTSRTVTLGSSADIPVPSDYDADGTTDVAVYRPSTGQWTIMKSTDGSPLTSVWGTSGSDVPLPRHP
jgi:IPT/TIG domain-containing protein/VCBS repeat protein